MADNQKAIDYDKIAELESFKQLTKKKNKFLWTLTAIFLAAYMLLPILTSYTTILHQKAIGGITWVWIYSAGLFIMTWGLAHFYVSRANRYDKDAQEVIDEYERGAN
ncbi:membrane protein [Lysinibacillus sp. PLM2]|nr:membrane protein [Lysinibacillus sp. PLM2]